MTRLGGIGHASGDEAVWVRHGRVVESFARYMPSSFDHTPRNIAEKVTSGYKAEEWMLYTWTILPGLLHTLLPPVYFFHFCHLVAGVRVALQRRVKVSQLLPAHNHLVTYVEKFEETYYQRRLARLHFVRPALHLLVHLIPEIFDVGSGPTHTQYTLENFIGNIGDEIHQHSNPYANVAERASRRVQVSICIYIYIHVCLI